MEHFVTSGKAKIWTHISDDSGDCGKPYLFLYGGGPGCSDGLVDVDPLINHRFNTIRFDPRGCGRTAADGNYGIETAIEDVEAIRQFYGVESWHMLGHSWGADLSLFYALKYTQHCKSLVHFCGHGVHNDADWAEECAKGRDEPNALPKGNGYPMNYEVLDQQLNSYWKYIQAPMLLKHISALKIPVLVLCAKNDPRPMWPNVQLANLLPHAALNILPECGHFTWVTHPDLLRNTILDWYDHIFNNPK